MAVAIGGSTQKSFNNLFSFSSLATTLSSSILGVSSSPQPSSSSSSSSTTISTLSNYSPSSSPLSTTSSTVTLTRFNHRRSSFDYGNDDDNNNIDNGFKVCYIILPTHISIIIIKMNTFDTFWPISFLPLQKKKSQCLAFFFLNAQTNYDYLDIDIFFDNLSPLDFFLTKKN